MISFFLSTRFRLRSMWLAVSALIIISTVLLIHPIPISAIMEPTITLIATSISLPAGSQRIDSFNIPQVYVPAACFMMGSDSTRDPQAADIEQPIHRACLTEGYWLDQFDVTNAAFDAFVKAGGYSDASYWSTEGLMWRMSQNITAPDSTCTLYSSDPQQPRICINYYEAQAYAHWRGGELPSETQWEYAARGVDQRIYPWGNTFDPSKANTNVSGRGKTTPIDRYPAGKSWVGAYDMAGNVWQWVSNGYYGNYAQATPSLHVTGLPASTFQVVRGGSWLYEPVDARTTHRDLYSPTLRKYDVGFRVVMKVIP